MEFYVRVYKIQSELMVAACDVEVHGKRYEEGDVVLKGEEKFYGSERMNGEETRRLLRHATIANLLGRDIVEEGIRIGIIDPEQVIRVKGVPHAQMVRMR
jgi:hypothetical protein